MMATPAPATPAPRPRRTVRSHLMRAVALPVALIGLAVAGGYAFLSTQVGVDFAVDQLMVRSGGRLQVEGATGSLLQAVRAERLVWKGPEAKVTATGVTLRWSPLALWSRGVLVHALGAEQIDVELKPSTAAASPPESLALPFEIEIERLAIGRLDWRVGPRGGTIRGLGLNYSGGAQAHRFRNLSLAADIGTLAGGVSIGAEAPFAIDGRLVLEATAALREARATLNLSGTLTELAVDGAGTAGSARIAGRAVLAPLGTVPLVRLSVDARELDLSAWDKALPATRLDLVAEAVPDGGGFSGKLDATNALPGPIDAGRVPVRTLAAGYAWQPEAIRLDGLVAELSGGGRAAGSARIPLSGARSAGTWSLDVRDIDLRQIYGPLIATRPARIDRRRPRCRPAARERRHRRP